MKKFIFFFCILPTFAFSQINNSGFSIYKWGISKTTIPTLTNCNEANAGLNFVNCDVKSKDSIFFDEFHYDYCNYRFFNGQFSEINFDLRYKELAAIIAKLSSSFGNPRIIENSETRIDTSNTILGYEWIVGDTRIFIINKGRSNPVWCNVSSQKIRKTYKKTIIDIEKLIFN